MLALTQANIIEVTFPVDTQEEWINEAREQLENEGFNVLSWVKDGKIHLSAVKI